MKIVFTTKGDNWDSIMDPRFGRTEFFLIYDEDKDELAHYDNREAASDAHGAGPKTAQKLFEFHPDVLITGNGPGGNAAAVLEKTGIRIITGAADMTAKEAYEKYRRGELN
ncbi:MAG: NifB/NifX family molybdenum-iron cluster-binding protein [Bacteroidales bacterium]|nr:NifB/NifX family molybdenum-iron cluster-binding protein [Bacteroidales bacterium]